jgi:hypothetical protein
LVEVVSLLELRGYQRMVAHSREEVASGAAADALATALEKLDY